jgi:hypothetical protein
MAKMEMGAELKLQGLFLRDPDKAIKIFEEEFGKALDESTSFLMRTVIRGTPVHSGALRGSVFREIRGRGLAMHGVVATNWPYAEFIETGQPAHTPNYANLADWIRLKLGLSGDHLYAVLQVIAKQIRTRGIRPHFMFKKAFEAGRMRVQGILNEAASRIIERWK